MTHTRRQLVVFGVLIATNATLIVLVFVLGMGEAMLQGRELPPPLDTLAPWILGAANAGITIVLYGLLGLAGFWFARKLDLPGIFREGAGWRSWVWTPMWLGAIVGIVLVAADRMFASAIGWDGFPHPAFPLSLFASATAGIGEEVLFRLFVMGLWAYLLNLVTKRWGLKRAALWAGNVIAALAFGAAHLPSLMMIQGVASPGQIAPVLLVELFLLNGIVGVVAGQRCMRDGLVAAIGVHFWTDIVWHACWSIARSWL